MIKKCIEHIERTTSKRLLLYLTAIFVFSHIVYFMMGVRFDDSSLNYFWQYLDPELLRNKLLESCFYLHSQPPLFNLFLGIVLKLSSRSGTLFFQGIYLICGLILYFVLFLLQIRLGVSRPIALMLSTLFMISPSYILYEHWLFYPFPVAVLLTLSALFLHEFLERRSGWPALCFFISLLLVCGIRSVFHLSYYFFIVVMLATVYWRNRRKIILTALVPFLLLLSFYCKNFVLFGKFTTSTWMGMNAWSTTGENMPLRELQQLVTDGKLSQVSSIRRFSSLELYPATYVHVNDYEDVPALRQVKKSTGYNNYNHLAYIAISDQYFKDALYVLRHYPKAFFIGILRSWLYYFKSGTDLEFGFLKINRNKLSFMNSLYDFLFYGKVPFNLSQVGQLPIYPRSLVHYPYLFLLSGFPVLVFHALKLALKKNSTGKGLSPNQRISILYICFNIIYVALIGNLFESYENNRFRFETDPLYLTLLGVFLQYFLMRRLAAVLRKGLLHIPSLPSGAP